MKKLILSALLVLPMYAHGHARLKAIADGGTIPPRVAVRSDIKDPEQLAAACGRAANGQAYPRQANPAQFTAGQMVTVYWEETIQHVGDYVLQFSPANDANWVPLGAPMVDLQNGQIMNGVNHQYSMTVQMPTTPCAACTIRLIQVMKDNPVAPTNYYNCGDIVLLAAGVPVPTTTLPSGAGVTTTSTIPTTAADCH